MHYFVNDENLKSSISNITVVFQEKSFSFLTDKGVFSKGRLDYGTRLLLESLNIPSLKGNVLDLGCGYGVVGVVLSKLNPNLWIDMVDVNKRALSLALENVKNNGLENIQIFESDGYKNVSKTYDYIVTNPPIRAGKKVTREFLIGASKRLEKSGELWFVMRKDHGAKTMVRELESYYEVKEVKKSKGFYVFCCFNR